ncbi:MAG: fumarylacetoacetate hydrolase family protein [Actinomycetia bacterium]|nr:fumarylacetoacetate hydrolase family protein [Actinomycetes bacterium]
MRFAKFAGADSRPFWGTIDDGDIVHRLGLPFTEWSDAYLREGASGLGPTVEAGPLAEVRLLAPLDAGGRVLAVGANYQSHLTRMGVARPEHHVAFVKLDSCIIGPEEPIRYPATTSQLDYELELVAVVGRALPDDGSDATACLLGYTVGNDVSVRDAPLLQGGPDLHRSKVLDGISPLGPWITTLDELGGPGQPALEMTLRVNGERRQGESTEHMLLPVDEILAFLDQQIRLRPGDVVYTGSPAGVGLEDGRFLQPGDVVEAEIEGIGTLRNPVGEKEPAGGRP